MENFSDQIKNITDKFDKPNESHKQNLIEQIKSTDPKERVAKLLEAGILAGIDNYTWGCLGGDRFFVFANIDGKPIPFYKTSARTGGKRGDTNFFPFFGVHTAGQPWLIKGDTEKDTNTFYGNAKMEETSKLLTEVFDFDTDRKIKVEKPSATSQSSSSQLSAMDKLDSYEEVDGYLPDGNEITGNEKLNQLLANRYNIDFEYINKMPSQSLQVTELVKRKILGE
jgi:hypothetical protein